MGFFMVKLKRIKTEDFIADTQPPDTAILYYGLKKESGLKEYQFFTSAYDQDMSISDILKSDKKPDNIFKSSSKYALERDLQNSGFLTSKDFGALNKNRDKNTRVLLGYILEPTYSISRDKWDYAEVYLNVDNSIRVIWKH